MLAGTINTQEYYVLCRPHVYYASGYNYAHLHKREAYTGTLRTFIYRTNLKTRYLNNTSILRLRVSK